MKISRNDFKNLNTVNWKYPVRVKKTLNSTVSANGKQFIRQPITATFTEGCELPITSTATLVKDLSVAT